MFSAIIEESQRLRDGIVQSNSELSRRDSETWGDPRRRTAEKTVFIVNLSLFAVLAFAVLVAGVAYAHVDRNEWCTGNTGWSHMTARHDGKDQLYNSPGWDTGDKDNGNKDTGNNK